MLMRAALYLLLAGLADASELPPLDTIWVNSMMRNPKVERVSVRDSAGTHIAILTFADSTADTIRFQGPHWPVVMAGDKPAVKYSREGFEVQGSPYAVIDTMHRDTAWEVRQRFAAQARFTWQLTILLRAYQDSCRSDSTLDCVYYLPAGNSTFPIPCESWELDGIIQIRPSYILTHRPPTFEGFMEFVERRAVQDSTALAEEK